MAWATSWIAASRKICSDSGLLAPAPKSSASKVICPAVARTNVLGAPDVGSSPVTRSARRGPAKATVPNDPSIGVIAAVRAKETRCMPEKPVSSPSQKVSATPSSSRWRMLNACEAPVRSPPAETMVPSAT